MREKRLLHFRSQWHWTHRPICPPSYSCPWSYFCQIWSFCGFPISSKS